MKPSERYAALVATGCTCGAEEYAPCPVHAKPGDNRGLRAYFEAGMPRGFPMRASCSECDADSLLYPNVDQLDPSVEFRFRRTLICPKCSGPGAERALVSECVAFGIDLNDKRVFALVAA